MESSRSSNSAHKYSNPNSNTYSTRNSIKSKHKEPTILPFIRQSQKIIPKIMQQYQSWQDIGQNINQMGDRITGISEKQILAQIQSYPILYDVYLKNADQPQIHNKIIYTLLKRPSKSDCPGYIYGFMNFSQHGPYDRKHFIKMGRTKHQIPQVRIIQWQREDNHQYTQIFTIRSQHNNKLQSLVHLFFNYARKPRQINGQRRIQWFYFEDRVLTAAAVQMINQIMYRIHLPQLRTPNNTHTQQILPNSNKALHFSFKQLLKNCIQRFNKQRIIKKSQKSLVLVGLDPKALKYVKNVYQQDILKFKSKTFGNYIFQVKQKNNKNIQYFVETMSFDELITPQNAFVQNFTKWTNILSSKKICFRVVLKQSDLESSNLAAVRNLLDFLQKITNLNKQEFSFCLFQAEKGTSQKQITEFLECNYKELLKSQHFRILTNSYYHIIQKPQIIGQTIQLLFKQKSLIIQQFKQQEQGKKSSLKFQNSHLNQICRAFSNNLVFDVNQILLTDFSKILNRLKYQTTVDKANKLYTINQIIKQVLYPNALQHTIYNKLSELFEWFEMRDQENLKSLVNILIVAFCQCNTYGNLSQSKFLENLKIQIKKQQNSLSQLMNVQINKQTQQFHKNINRHLASINVKYIDGELKNIELFANIIGFFEELKNKYFNSELQLFQMMTKNQVLYGFQEFQKMTKLVQQVIEYQQKGIRCNRIYSKMKQFGFKVLKQWQNHQLLNKDKINRLKDYKKKREIPIQVKKAKSNQRILKITNEQTAETSKTDDKKIEQQKRVQKDFNFQDNKKRINNKKQKAIINKKHQSKQHTLQISNMKKIIQFSQKIHELDSIMNICKNQFYVDVSEGVKFLNSTIILAKHILIRDPVVLKVDQSEKQQGQKKRKKKYLILFAGSYQGIQKVQLYKSSGWNVCVVQYNRETGGPRMLIDKHNQKTLERLKIQNLIDFYQQTIG